MANDLNELNSILFQTLRGVSSGEVDTKKANSVIGLSNALVNNAKLQIQAMKLSGQKRPTKFLGIGEAGHSDRYTASATLAESHGFGNVADAVKHFGQSEWNKMVDNYMSTSIEIE